MTLTERTGVTADQVKAELFKLEEGYNAQRKAMLDKLGKPYRQHRDKLRRLLDVLETEGG
jgi:hypothetical protein